MATGKWLEKFRNLFPEATHLFTGRRQDLEAVERFLDPARTQMRVGPAELRLIESADAWSYPNWWPRLSDKLEKVIELPKNLTSPKARHKVVDDLQACLKHIEVVSVVLRFLCPQQFGIISPPVVSLLNLTPTDHVPYYMRYLDVLENLAGYYGLQRVADVDMALWTAAHSYRNPAWASFKQQMEEDKYFQEVRLQNLLDGLSMYGGEVEEQRLRFARALIRHDHLTAALIAARSYESLVLETAGRLGIKRGPTKTGSLVDEFARHPARLRSFGLSPGDLQR